MRGLSAATLALASVLAITATIVAPASGALRLAEPEWGRCVGGGGVYKNGQCTTQGSGLNDEWHSGVGGSPAITDPAFTTRGGKSQFLPETPGAAAVQCKKSAGAGDLSATREVTAAQIEFTSCEEAGKSCSSAGSPGVIATGALEGTLGYIKAPAPPGTVGLELGPLAGSTVFATFKCGGGPTTVLEGSVIALIGPFNRMRATDIVRYRASGGVQEPTGFEGGPPQTRESAGVRVGLTASQTIVFGACQAWAYSESCVSFPEPRIPRC